MHNFLGRLNAVSALATTILLSLLLAVGLSSYAIPARLEPASLKVNSVQVVLGRTPGERKEQQFAFARFDIKADLAPLWNWNTKQVFLQFTGHYDTPDYPDNQVVIWDRIVRRKRDTRINVEDLRNKYAFKDMGRKGLSGLNATFALHYNVMPHVGMLRYGIAGRTESITFPPVQASVR